MKGVNRLAGVRCEFRDEVWLIERLRALWVSHFADSTGGQPILIRFGRCARYRYGSITSADGVTIVTINGLFANSHVPEIVVDATIAHELAHYVHGFGSGLPQKHRHAHRGGIVDAELSKRGLADSAVEADLWLRRNWTSFYAQSCPDVLRREELSSSAWTAAWVEMLSTWRVREENYLQERQEIVSRKLECHAPLRATRLGWHYAGPRVRATSCYVPAENVVMVHALLALHACPEDVLDIEIGYWLMRRTGMRSWNRIGPVLIQAGMAHSIGCAIQWRQTQWKHVRTRHMKMVARRAAAQ